jgi:hypothetical protein
LSRFLYAWDLSNFMDGAMSVIPEKLTVTQLVKNSPPFVEPEGSFNHVY